MDDRKTPDRNMASMQDKVATSVLSNFVNSPSTSCYLSVRFNALSSHCQAVFRSGHAQHWTRRQPPVLNGQPPKLLVRLCS